MKLRLADHLNYFAPNGKLFCKKKDKVETLNETQASCWKMYQCEFGCLQGEGIEWQWLDEFEFGDMYIEDPYKECKRVLALIKQVKQKKDNLQEKALTN